MNGHEKPKSNIRAGHYGRFNALVDRGWLSVLGPVELALWMAYEKFADDATGDAYPDGRTLARLIGHASASHIGTARKSLCDHGLLQVLNVGGGRGNPFEIRVLIPPDKGSEFGNLSAEERFPIWSGKVPDSGIKGSRSGEHNKEEHPREHPREHPSSVAEPRGTDPGSKNAGVSDSKNPKPSKRKAKPSLRVLSDEQVAIREAFADWYITVAFPKANGGTAYNFAGSRDGAAVLKILQSKFVDWNLKNAQALAWAYLQEKRDSYILGAGFTLWLLADRINRFAPKADEILKKKGYGPSNGNHRETSAVGGIREFGVEKSG